MGQNIDVKQDTHFDYHFSWFRCRRL